MSNRKQNVHNCTCKFEDEVELALVTACLTCQTTMLTDEIYSMKEFIEMKEKAKKYDDIIREGTERKKYEETTQKKVNVCNHKWIGWGQINGESFFKCKICGLTRPYDITGEGKEKIQKVEYIKPKIDNCDHKWSGWGQDNGVSYFRCTICGTEER